MDETTSTKSVIGHNIKQMMARAEDAAKADFDKQRSFDSAYDRRKGFMAGVQWAAQQMQKKIEKKS